MKPIQPVRMLSLALALLVLAPLAQAQSVSPNRYSQPPQQDRRTAPPWVAG